MDAIFVIYMACLFTGGNFVIYTFFDEADRPKWFTSAISLGALCAASTTLMAIQTAAQGEPLSKLWNYIYASALAFVLFYGIAALYRRLRATRRPRKQPRP